MLITWSEVVRHNCEEGNDSAHAVRMIGVFLSFHECDEFHNAEFFGTGFVRAFCDLRKLEIIELV